MKKNSIIGTKTMITLELNLQTIKHFFDHFLSIDENG